MIPGRLGPAAAGMAIVAAFLLGAGISLAADEKPAAPPTSAPEEKPAATPAPPATPATPAEEKASPAGYADPAICATCHEDVANALKLTTHGKTKVGTWDGGVGCQSCHGPGAAHAEDGDKTKIRNPKNLSATDLNAVCLTCHERGDRSHWQGSQHENRGLSCTSCHSIHFGTTPPPAKLLAKGTEFATCTSCHLKRKASLLRSAHMPMREGSMTCTSCHNPHGSPGPTMLKQFSVNENCYSCHAEKRSPVLWEHPPVREDCTTCHDPHGSLHPRLLIAKQPRLCQQCHDETRHPTQPYSDASSAPEFFPNVRMFDRGCMNCHSQIHGSNHPAGMRFLR